MRRKPVPLHAILMYFIHRTGGWVDRVRVQVFVLLVDATFLRLDGRTLIDFGTMSVCSVLEDLCDREHLLLDDANADAVRYRINPKSPANDENTGYRGHVDSYMRQGTMSVLDGVFDGFRNTTLSAALDKLHDVLADPAHRA